MESSIAEFLLRQFSFRAVANTHQRDLRTHHNITSESMPLEHLDQEAHHHQKGYSELEPFGPRLLKVDHQRRDTSACHHNTAGTTPSETPKLFIEACVLKTAMNTSTSSLGLHTFSAFWL